ncbi:MAG: histidinol-phosphatase [Clostridia bacterium]|nr:histidinol-phosphatase [Clostridia bacterium]
MILEDFHVHSTYCDGKNTLEEMVRSAIDLKMTRIGFSGHAYTAFSDDYCMSLEDTKKYAQDIAELKEKYADKITILCGLEMDYFSDKPNIKTDYLIGSVHYVKKDGKYLEVDCDEEDFKSNVANFFGGDYYAYAEQYFALVGDVIGKTEADIVGHFDLCTKFNEENKLFDTRNPRYVTAAKSAIDKLILCEKPFEINTGAISRGYRTEAYPEMQFLEYIAEKGGKVILSSDSHCANTLCYKFEEYERIAKDMGFKDLRF